MSDLRKEIPQRAFINAQIIQIASSSSCLNPAIEEIKRKYGLSDYQFVNPAHIVSLLYCLLVVPREFWLRNRSSPIYSKLAGVEPEKYFRLELTDEKFNEHPLYHLIRSLRNSIAHAQFSVDSSMNFTFEDQKPSQRTPHFRAKASIEELSKFISEVGSFLANLRSEGV